MDERTSRWRGLFGLLALAVCVGAIGGAFAGASVALLIPRNDRTESAARLDTPVTPSTLVQVKEDSLTTDTFKKVAPAVVTLTVQAQYTNGAGQLVREVNLGSGVIIDPAGYLVTNEHVVHGAQKIVVKLADGSERPGVVVGDDMPFTDIAVVRIQPDGITALRLGDSDALVNGQTVLAIGTVAFGPNETDFRNNITRGIVSGLHRRWPREDTIMEDLIQTDAAVNHGNSGGALVTLTGELIGIPTTVIRGTQNNQSVEGVAFALSSRSFRPLIDQLIQKGKTERPFVGIVHQQLTPELVQRYRAPVKDGAIVADVVADSPAARAGVLKGDVVTKLGDRDITNDEPYINALARQKPNSNVPLTLNRAGRELKVSLDVTAR